jgi:hypothetical protein
MDWSQRSLWTGAAAVVVSGLLSVGNASGTPVTRETFAFADGALIQRTAPNAVRLLVEWSDHRASPLGGGIAAADEPTSWLSFEHSDNSDDALSHTVDAVFGTSYATDALLPIQERLTADGTKPGVFDGAPIVHFTDTTGASAVITNQRETDITLASVQPNGFVRAPLLGVLLGLGMVGYSVARRVLRR